MLAAFGGGGAAIVLFRPALGGLSAFGGTAVPFKGVGGGFAAFGGSVAFFAAGPLAPSGLASSAFFMPGALLPRGRISESMPRILRFIS